MDITQCILTRDKYIIRKLEGEIIKCLKAELLRMGQKICINLVNEEGNLLRAKPKDWTKIKNKKFIIINS
jgi:hypothetical protein